MKPEIMVSSKDAFVLNWRSLTHSHEIIVAQPLFHVDLFMASSLKQVHFRRNHSLQVYETVVSSVYEPPKTLDVCSERSSLRPATKLEDLPCLLTHPQLLLAATLRI
jgi:hypothetical protein